MSHGIPKLILPINEEGAVEVDQHRKWLADHQTTENQPTPLTASTRSGVCGDLFMPTDKDVLLGRGKMVDGNAGNVLLKRIVASNYGRFQSSSRFEKTIVTHTVYLRMKKSGSRFLKKTDGNWIVVEEAVAREKISHAFRNYKARGPSSSQPRTTGTVADSSIQSLPAKSPGCFFS
jgi:hypothetical protein